MRKLLALLVVAGSSLLPVLPAAATTGSGRVRSTTITPSPAAAAAAWLDAQVDPGGFIPSSVTPGTANLGLTAQAVLSLAAAGVGKVEVDAMETYLAAHVDGYVQVSGVDQPGPLAFLILDAVATGRDATAFGGTDLVARLQATQQGSGLFGSADATYDGAFRQSLSLLALHAAGASSASGAAWLAAQQCADGGWTAYRADTSVACPAVDPATFTGEDTNSTATAAEALHVVGTAPAHDPLAWLASVRSSDGGFPYLGLSSLASDADSTGIVTQALLVLTGAPDTAGIAALEAFQAGCTADAADRGGVAYQPDTTGALFPDTLATIQALWGLAGKPFPLASQTITPVVAVPCAVPVTTSTTSTTTTAPVTTSVPPSTSVATAVTTPTDPTSGELPATGWGSGPLLLAAFLFLTVGAGLVLGARRGAGLDR